MFGKKNIITPYYIVIPDSVTRLPTHSHAQYYSFEKHNPQSRVTTAAQGPRGFSRVPPRCFRIFENNNNFSSNPFFRIHSHVYNNNVNNDNIFNNNAYFWTGRAGGSIYHADLISSETRDL